jgi:hypothetical protein
MAALQTVSGLDDLFYDVTLIDESTGGALNPASATSVTVSMCRVNTTTALDASGVQALASQGAGRWTGVHNDTNILNALTAGGIQIGQRFDLVLTVGTLAVRKLGTCQRVAIIEAA